MPRTHTQKFSACAVYTYFIRNSNVIFDRLLKLYKFIWMTVFVPVMFTLADPVGIEELTGRIAAGKATVVDYFLACDVCETHASSSTYEAAFDFRTKVLIEDEPTFLVESPFGPGMESLAVVRRVIDKKNGYMSIAGIYDQMPFTYTGAMFFGADRKSIFGWSFFHEDERNDLYLYHFVEHDGTRWRDVSSEVVPTYAINEFASGKEDFEFADQVKWEIVLPRHGTTAYLLPKPSHEITATKEKYHKYQAYVGNSYAMELSWDKQARRFMKGKILDKKGYEIAPK